MIIIKSKKYPFRDRVPEWVLSVGLLLWGVVLSLNPSLFTTMASLKPLLTVAPQAFWAVGTILIGLYRLFSLTIENYFSKTPHMRAIGAASGIMVWGSFFIVSLLNMPERVSGIPIYGMLLTFDFLTLWWAAGDAKLVDQLAKSSRGVNGNT